MIPFAAKPRMALTGTFLGFLLQYWMIKFFPMLLPYLA